MLKTAVKNGFINGIKYSWFLIKIIIPVYFLITAIKYSPAMDWLVTIFTPVAGVFNLPGEAAVPLISAFVLDEYGAIAAIKAVNLSGYSVTVVAVMTLISHSLIIETAILKKMSLNAVFFNTYRLFWSIAAGLALNVAGVALSLW